MVRRLVKGEKRNVAMTVERRTGEDFVIESAKYRVVDKENNAISSGDCTIDEKSVYFLFDAKDSGQYYAYFTVRILGLPKVIKDIVVVSVR